jgi:hypothetical protein
MELSCIILEMHTLQLTLSFHYLCALIQSYLLYKNGWTSVIEGGFCRTVKYSNSHRKCSHFFVFEQPQGQDINQLFTEAFSFDFILIQTNSQKSGMEMYQCFFSANYSSCSAL